MNLLSITLLLTLLIPTHPTSTIPRSTTRPSFLSDSSPPWNPSPKIDSNGFLTEHFVCVPGDWEVDTPLSSSRHARPSRHVVSVRQVPGDGNCLFHSISAGLALAENRTHADMANTTVLRECSSRLRHAAVDCLSRRPRRVLFLQGDEYLRACDLVEAAASQYNMTGEKYCRLMRRESYWGGGPEIVALSNVLRRPIYVYELTSRNDGVGGEGTDGSKKVNIGFCLRRMACFGSPKFDRKEPLHILSADSRFPDVSPGRQLANGNHFLALFPLKGRVESGIRAGAIKNGERRWKAVFNLPILDFWVEQIAKVLGSFESYK